MRLGMSEFWEIIGGIFIFLNVMEVLIINFIFVFDLEYHEPFGSKDFYKNTIWWFRLPIEGVKSLYNYCNIFGTIILAFIGMLFYPAVVVVMIAWCICSTIVWIFRIAFVRKEKRND